jgi:UDP-N-acetylmuramate-alanine ligase
MLPRKYGVVTNLEPDHLEHHGGYAKLKIAFHRFVSETDGPVLVGVDDEGGRGLAAEADTLSIGADARADWQIQNLEESWEGVRFALRGPDGGTLPVELPLPGAHNARNAADILYMTDVYPAGERPRTGVSGRLIVDAIRDAHPDQDVRYVVRREELVVQLADELEAGDLCLTMGAGDLTSVPDEVRAMLEARDRG